MTIGPAAAIRARWWAAVPIASLVLAAVAVGWHTVALAAGYLLNNYPFLSPDSYDWILEGVYLTRMLTGPAPATPLPVGRSPVFVLLMAMDAALGQRGWVFAAVSAATLLGTGWLLLPHWGRFRYATAVALSGLVLVLVAPVNFLRFYVLSDTLCVALSIAAFLLMFRASDEQGGSWSSLLAGVDDGAGRLDAGLRRPGPGDRGGCHRDARLAPPARRPLPGALRSSGWAPSGRWWSAVSSGSPSCRTSDNRFS